MISPEKIILVLGLLHKSSYFQISLEVYCFDACSTFCNTSSLSNVGYIMFWSIPIHFGSHPFVDSVLYTSFYEVCSFPWNLARIVFRFNQSYLNIRKPSLRHLRRSSVPGLNTLPGSSSK